MPCCNVHFEIDAVRYETRFTETLYVSRGLAKFRMRQSLRKIDSDRVSRLQACGEEQWRLTGSKVAIHLPTVMSLTERVRQGVRFKSDDQRSGVYICSCLPQRSAEED